MAVQVFIPTPLRAYTDHQDAVLLNGSTVGELLQQLTMRYRSLRTHLYREDGKLRSYVAIYVNSEDIRYLQKEQTPVTDKDVVSIIPSIAGGKEG
jgi:adenylyltransferase/sulfurtransferase